MTDTERQRPTPREFATASMAVAYYARECAAGTFMMQLHGQYKILQSSAAIWLAEGDVDLARRLTGAADLLYNRWIRILHYREYVR